VIILPPGLDLIISGPIINKANVSGQKTAYIAEATFLPGSCTFTVNDLVRFVTLFLISMRYALL